MYTDKLKSEIASILFEEVKKKLDPVGKEDKDVDNDGDEDSSDEYLLKRRDAVKKAISKRGKNKNKLLNDVKEQMERHPFDAESGPGEFDVAAVHDHIEDHGGIPLTPENVKKHDIHFTDDKFYDRQETFVNAGKGPLSKTATNMHVFNTPSGEKVHGMFAQPNDFGASAYEQHPHFPGKRVFQSGIFDVIDHHDLPEKRMFEGFDRNRNRGYSKKEIQEATMNRINNIGKIDHGTSETHPGIGRIR